VERVAALRWGILTHVPDRKHLPARLLQLAVGLLLYGFSIAIYVRSELGLDPWDVFHQGIADHTGISFGMVVVLVGVIVLALWLPLRARPGIGTIANVLAVGTVADLVLAHVGSPHDLGGRIAMLVAAVAGNAIATGLYIGSGLGAGPRDGLTVAVVARTGWSIRVTRTAVEVAVLAAGVGLGGTIGIGTLLYAVAIGPLTHLTIPFFSRDRRLHERARVAACAAS
jgi:uncharacterized membrane protein YczE